MTLRNTTELEFNEVCEKWREYDFLVDGVIVTMRVENVRYVNVNPVHGAHRLLDADGVCHYMPGNWMPRVGLRWEVEEGEPHFSLTIATRPEKDNEPKDCCDEGGPSIFHMFEAVFKDAETAAPTDSYDYPEGDYDVENCGDPDCTACSPTEPGIEMPESVAETIRGIQEEGRFTTEGLIEAAEFFSKAEAALTGYGAGGRKVN